MIPLCFFHWMRPLHLICLLTGIIIGGCEGQYKSKYLNPPTVTVLSGDGRKLEIQVQPPFDVSISNIIRYDYELNGSGKWLKLTKTPPFIITLSETHTTHMIRMRAVDKHGAGEPSLGVFASATDHEATFSHTQKCPSGGSGESVDDPVIICDYNDLKAIGLHNIEDRGSDKDTIKNRYFALGTHIDATPSYEDGKQGCKTFQPTSSVTSSTCTGWTPLLPFKKSHLDGRNYLIVGLYGTFKEQQYGGLISQLDRGSSISNLHLRNTYFFSQQSNQSYLGALAGSTEDSMISNVSVVGGILKSKYAAGGLVGILGRSNKTSHIKNAYSSQLNPITNVTHGLQITAQITGGLVGITQNSKLHSVASTDVSLSNNGTVGGIAGHLKNNSTLKYVMVRTSLSALPSTGSLVGENTSSVISSAAIYPSSTAVPPCGKKNPAAECSGLTSPDGFITNHEEISEPKICIRNCDCIACDSTSSPVFQDKSIFSMPPYIR